EDGPFLAQALEPAGVQRGEAVEVVEPHLVDRDHQHQPRAGRARLGRQRRRAGQQEGDGGQPSPGERAGSGIVHAPGYPQSRAGRTLPRPRAFWYGWNVPPQQLSGGREERGMASSTSRGKPTITDVARQAGVSKSLVSLVMRGARHVSPARRAAVLEAGAALRYRPNAMARGLKQRSTRLLGVLCPDLHDPFVADVVEGGQERARRAGYRVLVSTGLRGPGPEDEATETLLELRVDALVLAGVPLESRLIVEASRQVPTVLVGRAGPAASVDSASHDERPGAARS